MIGVARAERSIIGIGSKEICLEVTPRDDEIHRESDTVEYRRCEK